jgi:hypothetical protein
MVTLTEGDMRTQDDIIQRIESRKENDFMGFEVPFYLDMLTFENAKQYLVDDAVEANWTQLSANDIKAKAIDYMAFAWKKANNCRGISAGRSISHYIAWLWLLGEDGFDDMEDYEYYGKPQLIRVCEYLGLDHTLWDDGVRTNDG